MTSSELKTKKNQYTRLLNSLNDAIAPLNRAIESASTVSNNLINYYSVNGDKPDNGISKSSVSNLNAVKNNLNNMVISVQNKITRLNAEIKAAKEAEAI